MEQTMTAKVLATLGALGLIATIWTADFRYLWTGLLLLTISVGIAAHKDGPHHRKGKL